MDYSVDKDDVQHIIIDNLQFMMPRGTTRSYVDKFDYQDSVIDKFRKLATEKNVSYFYCYVCWLMLIWLLLGECNFGNSSS